VWRGANGRLPVPGRQPYSSPKTLDKCNANNFLGSTCLVMTSLPRLLNLVLLASINKRRDKGRTYFTGVMRSALRVRGQVGPGRPVRWNWPSIQQRAATCGFYRGLPPTVLCIRPRHPQPNNAGSCVQAYSSPRKLPLNTRENDQHKTAGPCAFLARAAAGTSGRRAAGWPSCTVYPWPPASRSHGNHPRPHRRPHT
jgi:hypothetical protein